MTEFKNDPVVSEIIGAAVEVHRFLGPGLLESTYQRCLSYELAQRGIAFAREVPVPVRYKDVTLDCGYRIDLLVDQDVVVEVKSVEKLLPIHDAQVLTYLNLVSGRHAMLFNFNSLTLKSGMRSFVGRGKYVPPAEPNGSAATHS